MNAIGRPLPLCALAALSSLTLLANAGVHAGTLNASHLPSIKMSVSGYPTEWDYSPPQTAYAPSPDGYQLSYVLDAYGVCDNTSNIKIQKLEFNSDPFVLNNILVTNTTAVNQIYSVTVGLPTTFGAPNMIGGTITTSVIDADASGGATLSTVSGQPIYKAQIDFNTVATLQNAPFNVSTPGSNSASASLALSPNALPVLNNIGIVLTFQLTPGDTAAILSRFDVIPEPTGLLWCALVVVGIFRHRRRHI
jgi:hypothetical protein